MKSLNDLNVGIIFAFRISDDTLTIIHISFLGNVTVIYSITKILHRLCKQATF